MFILSFFGVLLIMAVGFYLPHTVANLLLGYLLVNAGFSGLIWIIFVPLTIITLLIDVAWIDKIKSSDQ